MARKLKESNGNSEVAGFVTQAKRPKKSLILQRNQHTCEVRAPDVFVIGTRECYRRLEAAGVMAATWIVPKREMAGFGPGHLLCGFRSGENR